MHSRQTWIGAIILISGTLVALSGYSMMITTGPWLGTFGDTNNYNNGLMCLIFGGVLAFIGFSIMLWGLWVKENKNN